MKKTSLRNFIKEANNLSSVKSSESKETLAIQVGERLKKARNTTQSLSGLTLTKIADQLDIDKTVICHYEAGRRTPTLIDFKHMCERYNVDPIDILGIQRVGGNTIHNYIGEKKSIDKNNSDDTTHEKNLLPI